jgi:hypothetical protein
MTTINKEMINEVADLLEEKGISVGWRSFEGDSICTLNAMTAVACRRIQDDALEAYDLYNDMRLGFMSWVGVDPNRGLGAWNDNTVKVYGEEYVISKVREFANSLEG